MPITCPQLVRVSPFDQDLGGVDFQPDLRRIDPTETLAGVPTVTEVDTSDLTIDNIGLNTESVEILKQDVPPNNAVVFRFSGQQRRKTYRLRVRVLTSSDPQRILERDVRMVAV